MSDKGTISGVMEDAATVKNLAQGALEDCESIKAEVDSVARDLNQIIEDADEIGRLVHDNDNLEKPFSKKQPQMSKEERNKFNEDVHVILDDTKDAEGLESEIEQVEGQIEQSVQDLKESLIALKRRLGDLEEHESPFRQQAL